MPEKDRGKKAEVIDASWWNRVAERLADQSRRHEHLYAATRFEERARGQAAVIRRVLTERTPEASTGTA